MTTFVLNNVEDIEYVATRGFEILVDFYNKEDKDEVLNVWNRLYNLYFKLLKKSNNIGFVEAKIIQLEEYEYLKESISGTPYYNIGFNEQENIENRKKWIKFKNDILERGSFFVFFVTYRGNNLSILEGKHRLAAINELIDEGKLPKNYKILCCLYDEKTVFTNKIAIQLGNVEKVLREKHNIFINPRSEFLTPGYFGYMFNLPRNILIHNEQKIKELRLYE